MTESVSESPQLDLAAIVALGLSSPNPGTRAHASRITSSIERLHGVVAGEAEDRKAAQEEVSRLRQALAEAEARAGGVPSTVKARQPRSARPAKANGHSQASKIRQWAVANNFEVAARGRISEAARTAYDNAHPVDATGHDD